MNEWMVCEGDGQGGWTPAMFLPLDTEKTPGTQKWNTHSTLENLKVEDHHHWLNTSKYQAQLPCRFSIRLRGTAGMAGMVSPFLQVRKPNPRRSTWVSSLFLLQYRISLINGLNIHSSQNEVLCKCKDDSFLPQYFRQAFLECRLITLSNWQSDEVGLLPNTDHVTQELKEDRSWRASCTAAPWRQKSLEWSCTFASPPHPEMCYLQCWFLHKCGFKKFLWLLLQM